VPAATRSRCSARRHNSADVEVEAAAAGFRTRRTGTSVAVLGIDGADGLAPAGERRLANIEDVFNASGVRPWTRPERTVRP
jgi:hypothetical protein